MAEAKMRFSGKFLTALFNRKYLFHNVARGKRSGIDAREKSAAMTEHPKTRVNYRRQPIPISNRFTVIIFASEYEAVCARSTLVRHFYQADGGWSAVVNVRATRVDARLTIA